MPDEGLCAPCGFTWLWLNGHYRLIWPADVLKRAGFNVHVIPPSKTTGFEAKTTTDANGVQRLTSVVIPEDADVIVIQRPAFPAIPSMIQILRSNGVAVVVDMDDDMSNIHPNNAAYHIYRHDSGTPFSWRHSDTSCKAATLVTTSTAALQKTYARHGRGAVLDNYVPSAYLTFPRQETGAFGWAGTTRSHPNDPQVVSQPIKKLIDDGYRFRIVGGDEGCRAAFRLPFRPEMTGSVGLERYAKTVADTLDVGIVPLDNTAFNASKSRLKGIEMMSVGVPWVASPRAEYRKLAKDSGCGFLAEGPKDWYTKVKALMDDEVLRKEQAQAGREYMYRQTYETNAWRWAEVWQRAYDIERGRAKSATVIA